MVDQKVEELPNLAAPSAEVQVRNEQRPVCPRAADDVHRVLLHFGRLSVPSESGAGDAESREKMRLKTAVDVRVRWAAVAAPGRRGAGCRATGLRVDGRIGWFLTTSPYR